MANALVDAIGDQSNLRVTHTVYPNIDVADAKVISLSSKESESLWTRTSLFAAPEPAMDEVVALGKQIGVDFAYMAVNQGDASFMDINIYLIDIDKGKSHHITMTQVNYVAAKTEVTRECRSILRKMGTAGEFEPIPTAVSTPESPASVAASRPLNAAFFPYHITNSRGTKYYEAMANWKEGCVRGIVKALNTDRGISLAFTFEPSKWIPLDTLIVDNVLNADTANQIWKKQASFDTDPALQSDMIAAFGKQIGADLIIVFRGYFAYESSFEVFLVDPNSGRMVSQMTTSKDNYPMKEAEQATKDALAKYWSSR